MTGRAVSRSKRSNNSQRRRMLPSSFFNVAIGTQPRTSGKHKVRRRGAMREITQVDADALSVMKQAGQEFAAKQVGRWSINDWENLSEEMRQELMAHWRAVKDRIGEIIQEIKRRLKENQ